MTLTVAYDDRLLKWQLGKGHPTNPARAQRAVALLGETDLGDHKLDVQPIFDRAYEDLLIVHDKSYVAETLEGWNSEWAGRQVGLGSCAALMFDGTMQLVDQILTGDTKLAFAPQGAKHHAMRDHGSGFCVFNDFAAAAHRFANEGMRVFYLDTDAHHGDGVEALCRDRRDIVTASIHDSSIFPGTGFASVPEYGVINYPLERDAGDVQLIESVMDALKIARAFKPDVFLWAIGGDGYKDDPLSSLQYTYGAYKYVAERVGEYVGVRDIPILLGGAGGYLPLTHTPAVWTTCVAGVARRV